MMNSAGWAVRTDSGAHVQQGETISVWVQLANAADGRAYFGFGASTRGTLSLVLAPNTGQLGCSERTVQTAEEFRWKESLGTGWVLDQ